MKIISNKSKLIKFTHYEKNLGLVPTMGAIHQGHISLIEKCISQCEKTIVSIFINKPQFNKKSDFQKYPRLLKKDISILKKFKVDYLYLPSVNQIYPNGSNKNIKISSFRKKLCGKFRKGHFDGVVTVLKSLFDFARHSNADIIVTIDGDGHTTPGADNTQDLGSSSKRWRNIYTTDLHLANERGNWTVIEEENYLTLRNNKTNKVYKLVMEEIE